LRAIHGVDVTTEVGGLIKQRLFTPGAQVTKNTLLVQLNADPDIAKLNSIKAQAALAEINFNRDKAQYAIKAVSKATLDNSEATLKNLQAQVAQQAALVAQKSIRAPFDGELGVALIDPGQYLNPGDKIVTLQTLNPIYADFLVPQQSIVSLKKGQPTTLTADAFPSKEFKGTITTINPKVEVNSRNVLVEATIDNSQYQLYPGMFAKAKVSIGQSQKFLTLPQTAITFNPYGDIVYLIEDKGKDKDGKPILLVKQTFVKVGEKRGDQVAILSGINEHDRVVTSGQLKLKNGARIVINNTVVPSNEESPQPVDE
jgi:membrane fusion protein, multidrug efflux system